jgi:hypothetical protein
MSTQSQIPKYELKYKVPVDFTFVVQRHIDSISIYVKRPEEKEWKEAIVEKELLESWGGYGSDCGGARYTVRVKHPDVILPIVIGEYSYQACTPRMPDIKNYARVELKFITQCDVRIATDKAIYTFFVRYLNEFEV